MLSSVVLSCCFCRSFPTLPSFFFFNDPATPEIYTLSLHDALPIFTLSAAVSPPNGLTANLNPTIVTLSSDRKSTRLNSSHGSISYAVFCLKKKKPETKRATTAKKTSHAVTRQKNRQRRT